MTADLTEFISPESTMAERRVASQKCLTGQPVDIPGGSVLRTVLGAAQLNAFELRMSHGLLVSCLLPCEASFFNHSCDPNALISVGETHAVSFVAAREIAAGEEVCISYVATDLPHAERQHIFRHKYGFECACPVCRAGADAA